MPGPFFTLNSTGMLAMRYCQSQNAYLNSTLTPGCKIIPNSTATKSHRIAVYELMRMQFSTKLVNSTSYTSDKNSWTGHCSPEKVLTIVAPDD
jgi:hypothetical protein